MMCKCGMIIRDLPMVVFRRTATTSREELSTSAFTSVSAGPVHESMVQTADDMAPGVDDVRLMTLLGCYLHGGR